MLFLEMIFKTVALLIAGAVLAVLELWTVISAAAWLFGRELPGLLIVPPLNEWSRALVTVFVLSLLIGSRVIVRLWNNLGAWEYFFVYRSGKY